jgi:DNA-binding NtrC family response regulator
MTSGKRVRCLVVDNDMALRVPLEDMLRSLGLEVFGTDKGKDAVVLQCYEPFDVMILSWDNIEFPGEKIMTGMFVLCDKLPKVIIMSGKDANSFHCPFAASSFLFKPFGSEKVIKAVLKALGESNA